MAVIKSKNTKSTKSTKSSAKPKEKAAGKSTKSSGRSFVGAIPKDARVSNARWAAWLAPEVAEETRHPRIKFVWVARSTLKPGGKYVHISASSPVKAAQAAFKSEGWKAKQVVIADEVQGHTAFVYEMQHDDATGRTRVVHVKTIPHEGGKHIVHDTTKLGRGKSTKSAKSNTMEEGAETTAVDHHRSAKADVIKTIVQDAKEATGRGEKTAVAKILTQVLREHLQHHKLGLTDAKASAESKRVVSEAVKMAKSESLSADATNAIKNAVADHVIGLLTTAE